MGRSLTISINSASGLRTTSGEGDISDPFVVCCFDSNVGHELGRTEVVENTANPEWNHTFTVDVGEHIQSRVESGKGEPKMITFCVYDGDVDSCDPLGVAGVSFKELLKKGHVEGDFKVFHGCGTVNVSVSMKKVKKKSMFTENGWMKIAGGVAVGTAAVGLVGAFLYNKNKKKKEKQDEIAALKQEQELHQEGEMDPAEQEYATDCRAGTSGLPFGFHEHSDSDDDETFKPWWQMEDEASDDEEDDEQGKWVFDEDGQLQEQEY